MNNHKVHVLCDEECLPYVFSNQKSQKYVIIFLDLDFHKIVNNNRFLSLLGDEVYTIRQVAFKRIEKDDKDQLKSLVPNVKMIDHVQHKVSFEPVGIIDRFI